MCEYPIVRTRRPPYQGPRPKVGQTVMACPVCRRFRCWDFTPDDQLRCEDCGYTVARRDAQ